MLAGIAEFIIIIIVLLAIAGLISLAFLILYIMSLSKALRLTEGHHTTTPGMAWLLLIPLFSLGWQFYILDNVTRGIKGKYDANGRVCGDAANPVGLAYCVLGCINYVPYLNVLSPLPCFILWIIYWVKIAGYNREMEMMQS